MSLLSWLPPFSLTIAGGAKPPVFVFKFKPRLSTGAFCFLELKDKVRVEC